MMKHAFNSQHISLTARVGRASDSVCLWINLELDEFCIDAKASASHNEVIFTVQQLFNLCD